MKGNIRTLYSFFVLLLESMVFSLSSLLSLSPSATQPLSMNATIPKEKANSETTTEAKRKSYTVRTWYHLLQYVHEVRRRVPGKKGY